MIFILVILTSIANAENWMRASDVKEQNGRGFAMRKECEAAGEKCQMVDGMDFRFLMLLNGKIVQDQLAMDAWKKLEAAAAEKVKAKDLRKENLKKSVASEPEGMSKELAKVLLDID